MDWSDERYVRVYTRDTADFLALSFEAQGLLGLIIRKLDRAGVLELGRHGKRGVAIAIGHPARWDAIAPALEELLLDGCIVMDGTRLVMLNFIEAQEAVQSDRLRQAASRARRRELSNVDVTIRDEKSRDVTDGHAKSHESRNVTPNLAVLSLANNTLEFDIPRWQPDFESLYREYPRKEGKTKGMAQCAKQIRTPGDYSDLQKAIRNYAAVATPGFEKHFSSFMHCWRDYVDVSEIKPSGSNHEEKAALERANRVLRDFQP